jgi:hypothetical protein
MMAQATSARIVSAETIATSTSSAQSAVIAETAQRAIVTVRLVADVATWIEVGANPTAAAQSAGAIYLPAGVVEYIDVPPGQRLAAVLSSGTGFLNVATMV